MSLLSGAGSSDVRTARSLRDVLDLDGCLMLYRQLPVQKQRRHGGGSMMVQGCFIANLCSLPETPEERQKQEDDAETSPETNFVFIIFLY